MFLLAFHVSLSRFLMFSLVVINFVFCCSLVFVFFVGLSLAVDLLFVVFIVFLRFSFLWFNLK